MWGTLGGHSTLPKVQLLSSHRILFCVHVCIQLCTHVYTVVYTRVHRGITTSFRGSLLLYGWASLCAVVPPLVIVTAPL